MGGVQKESVTSEAASTQADKLQELQAYDAERNLPIVLHLSDDNGWTPIPEVACI